MRASRGYALELRANGGELVSSDGGGHFDSRSLTLDRGKVRLCGEVLATSILGTAFIRKKRQWYALKTSGSRAGGTKQVAREVSGWHDIFFGV